MRNEEAEAAVKALGERIGYGYVIQLCEQLWPPPSEPWTALERKQLNAEVERLRAENARLNKENDDWHEASKKLREEAQTARLALDVAQKQIDALNTAGEIGGAENQRLHAIIRERRDAGESCS